MGKRERGRGRDRQTDREQSNHKKGAGWVGLGWDVTGQTRR